MRSIIVAIAVAVAISVTIVGAIAGVAILLAILLRVALSAIAVVVWAGTRLTLETSVANCIETIVVG